MSILLLVGLLLLVAAMTVPLSHSHTAHSMTMTTTTANVVRPSTLVPSPSHPHGVLRSVFVPEDQIRSYMAVNRAKVHSSAPTAGGYTVVLMLPGANPFLVQHHAGIKARLAAHPANCSGCDYCLPE